MKLRLFLASGILLALSCAIVYSLCQREGGLSALAARAQDFAAKLKSQGESRPSGEDAEEATPAELPAATQSEPEAPAATAEEKPTPPPAEPAPAVEPEPQPEPQPEPEPAPQPEPEPEPAPQPEPEPEPAAAPQPAPYVPDPRYGRPGEGHEPEKYPEAFARFCAKLDEQVKLNLYDYCPSIQVLLEATNDEFALHSWMKAAADKGNAAAMHFVADAELTYVPADELQSPRIRKAYEFMCKSAALGYDPSKCSQSDCLHNGVGTRKDEAAARKVLMDACKGKGFIPRLRWLLTTERLKSFADAERPEVKAELERGNHHVTYFISRLAPEAAVQLEWLRKAAEQGNSDAFHDLAAVTISTKPKEGYELLKAAVGLHNRESLYLLGSSLLSTAGEDPLVKSLGLKADDAAAMRLIRTAAALRCPRAVYFMGRCYYSGEHGQPQDKALAYRHFSQALSLHSPDSGAAMGLMLLRGEGVQKDEQQGLRMITLAANSGYAYAICLMAYAHYKGLGTEADAWKASEFLQEAAALGMPEAYVYLAFITSRGGAGKAPSPSMAQSYLRMASVDMGERAKDLYAELEAAGEWEPEP